MNEHEFFMGREFFAHEYFGAHIDGDCVIFRIFAPGVRGVALMGDFNDWHTEPMNLISAGSIYELRRPAKAGQLYKYRIYLRDGSERDHCDPYAFGGELRPGWASRIADMSHDWRDGEFMASRDKRYDKPMNIYEVHLGSWLRKPEAENVEDGWYSYGEIAPKLAEYAKDMGYTHIEVLPLGEHPFDGSWGYQMTGYFCPTPRWGTAAELKEFVDVMHENGIGVITDFVPVHFAANDYALAELDGAGVYEYPNDGAGKSEWGTRNFNFFRGEVRSFIQSAANYWLSEYHFDGIRMDAISNCIYWQGNSGRGVNEGAVNFVRNMNKGLHGLHPGAILIAEDSSNYLKVTAPVEYDGLGFDYKWDMGWMNDTLDFFRLDPLLRGGSYHKLSFSMMYFYNELYLLPFSHDEVVHGKATIMQKMWGDYELKFPQCRALYAYMYTHPGKKLNFMGNEIGQLREWDEEKEPDYFLLKYPNHDSFKHYVRDLNKLYLSEPALHEGEYNSSCFRWLVVDDPMGVVYAYERSAGEERIVTVLNLSGNEHKDYQIGIDNAETLLPLINSDWEPYSGKTPENRSPVEVDPGEFKGFNGSFTLPSLPPLSAVIFKVLEK
ncbi:MAG: 1,4-alpha-glucan branching protein GlgB [Oscillospiraceae bacterium]|nr:1,4-alpha-glucan branching protein GlgB [Oscillospiraceae bacterium]